MWMLNIFYQVKARLLDSTVANDDDRTDERARRTNHGHERTASVLELSLRHCRA